MKNKKNKKRTMTQSILAGLLVIVMLFLEVATIFAAETNVVKSDIESPIFVEHNTSDIEDLKIGKPTKTSMTFAIETLMTQDRINIKKSNYGLTLWEVQTHDLYTFPTNVPNFIGASIDRIYPNITDQIDSKCIATYRSNDDVITVTFYNPSSMKLDINEIMVQSVVITPQNGTKLTIDDLEIENGDTFNVSDFVSVFGDYVEKNSYITDDKNAMLFWHFDTYAAEVLLEEGTLIWLKLSDKRVLLPTVYAETFYNFKDGELYRINVYDAETSSNNKFVTSFYVTKDEKEQLENNYFFKLYNAYAFTAGYLKQNETIEMLNDGNDYNTKIAALKNNLELYEERKESLTTVTTAKTDEELLKEKIIMIFAALAVGIIGASLGWKYIVKPKSGR